LCGTGKSFGEVSKEEAVAVLLGVIALSVCAAIPVLVAVIVCKFLIP